MKICLLSFHFAEYAIALAHSLAHRNEVLVLLNRENAIDELIDHDKVLSCENPKIMTVPRLRSGHPYGLINIVNIFLAVRRFAPDVIHVQETIRDYEFGSILLLRRFPLVLTIHDHVPHTGSGAKINPVRRRLFEPYTRRIPDAVIVHSRKIARETKNKYPWMQKRIYSIAHGVLAAGKTSFRTDWEIGTVLFFGRIEAYKGIGAFIEAVNRLKETGVPVKGIIAGRGPDLENHRRLISGQEWFELHDYYIPADKVHHFYRRANILVQPYKDATQSGVSLIALGVGRPIIATDVGGLNEVVKHGENGLVVPPGDIDALVEAMRHLILNQTLSRQFALQSYQMGRSDFSWASIADLTMKVYTDAIANCRSDRN